MIRSRPRVLALAAVVAASLVAEPSARAEDRSADAERLFREAQQLLEARDYANACPKLERAFTLDNKLGTLINLAFCHKAQETWWLAWLEFRHAEVMAIAQGRNDRRDFVRAQLTEIEKKARLALVIVDNPRSEALTEVLVEDRRVPEAESGAPFLVEPTTSVDRKFTFRAKGKKSVDKLVKVPRGEKTVLHVAVPPMVEAEVAPAAPAAATPLPVTPSRPGPEPAPNAPEPSSGASRVVGWGLVGLGVVSVGAGSFFGVKALGSGCAGSSEPPACTAEVKRDGDRDALISTVAIAGGAAAALGGTLLLVLAPSPSSARTSVRLEPTFGLGSAGIRGRF